MSSELPLIMISLFYPIENIPTVFFFFSVPVQNIPHSAMHPGAAPTISVAAIDRWSANGFYGDGSLMTNADSVQTTSGLPFAITRNNGDAINTRSDCNSSSKGTINGSAGNTGNVPGGNSINGSILTSGNTAPPLQPHPHHHPHHPVMFPGIPCTNAYQTTAPTASPNYAAIMPQTYPFFSPSYATPFIGGLPVTFDPASVALGGRPYIMAARGLVNMPSFSAGLPDERLLAERSRNHDQNTVSA